MAPGCCTWTRRPASSLRPRPPSTGPTDFYSIRGLVHDLVVWVLMLLGMAISVTGVVLGWQHLTQPRRPEPKAKHPAAA
jgi:cytochrome b subunit of formate dehydrogenase